MFKITPIQDKSRQKEICESFGAEFHEEMLAYIMYDIDTDELMGMSQFEIGTHGYIANLCEAPGREDFEAMFILGRQTMCFIESCGAVICRAARDAGDARLLRSIGFSEDGDSLVCDMTGMFEGNCKNH